jgi:hypothetical protein
MHAGGCYLQRGAAGGERGESDFECHPYKLERQPRPQLNFTSRSHRHGDRAELWRVDKPVGCPQVRFVERVESFGTELEIRLFT